VFFLQVTASLNNRPFFLFDMKLYYSIALWVITGLMFVYWMLLPEVEVKANEEVIEVKYATDRETHLYNKVEKTVDLPWFWDYQDLLASYAYNTCKKVISDTGKYSCENLVKTWNAENWWWKRDAWNKNKNWTHDWWLCQLNSAYHTKFIKSEWFENPLAQLDYCLQVRQDAQKKWKMPRYAYNVRHKRDRWITFKGSNAGVVNTHKQAVLNYYAKAVEATKTRQTLSDQLEKAKTTEVKARGDCIENKQCTDN